MSYPDNSEIITEIRYKSDIINFKIILLVYDTGMD